MEHACIHKQRGFSLMEVMVALVIFAMISVGAFGVLTELQRSKVALEERSSQLETLQRVTLIAWHDISQASPRVPLTDQGALSSLQITPSGVLTFTSSHWPNPMLEPRSTLAVIRYGTEGGVLVRQVWPFVATASSPAVLRQALAGNVSGVGFRSVASTYKSPFPAAVEMRLTLPPFGEIVQFVPLVQKP